MTYENQFLLALVITCLIETIVIFGIIRIFFKKEKISPGQIVFAGIFPSFATLPYLWFLLPHYLGGDAYILIGEASVVIIETIIISQVLNLNLKKSLALSFLANLTSFVLGLFILPALINLLS